MALEVFKRLGQQVARQVGREKEEAVRQLRQRLGVLLMRDNVAMLASRAPNLPPAEVDGDNDDADLSAINIYASQNVAQLPLEIYIDMGNGYYGLGNLSKCVWNIQPP